MINKDKKILISAIILLLIGMATRGFGTLLMHMMPSMAVADGVASPDRHYWLYWNILYIVTPYIITIVFISYIYSMKKHLLKSAAYTALTVFAIPVLFLFTIIILGIPLVSIPLVTNLLPIFQLISATSLFYFLARAQQNV